MYVQHAALVFYAAALAGERRDFRAAYASDNQALAFLVARHSGLLGCGQSGCGASKAAASLRSICCQEQRSRPARRSRDSNRAHLRLPEAGCDR